MKTKLPKIDANQRVLLVAFINATLAGLDGRIPRRVRLDHNTLELYQMVPLTTANDESALKVLDFVKPMIRALKRAKA